MAEVFVPHPAAAGMSMSTKRDAPECSQFSIDDPENGLHSPNQTYVFPAPATFTPSRSDQCSMSNPSTSSLRVSSHRHRPSNLSLSTLPPFDFGSQAQESSMKPNPSPTRSPVRLTPPISHPTGHRRGGSEFVGGGIAHGGPVLVNSSSADDDAPPAPPSPAQGPPPGRRGHSHRRSHAVSQSDVNSIMQPVKEHHPGSVPSTPSQPTFQQRPQGPERSKSHPGPSAGVDTKTHPPVSTASPGKAQARSRVGFSESLEFIPRPLSTISSETSSSMSTIRANHSVSDSVSSFVSGAASSPPSFRATNVTEASCASESPRTRPNRLGNGTTAFAEGTSHMTLKEGSQLNAPSMLIKSPSLEKMSTTDLKALDHIDQSHPSDAQGFTLPSNRMNNASFSLPASANPRQPPLSLSMSPQMRPRTSPESKVSTKQQRVKSWAETILHRKEKSGPNDPEPVTDSTPSASLVSHVECPDLDFSLDDITFDDDTTMIIEEPVAQDPSQQKARNRVPLQQFEKPLLSPDIAQPSPMIDLDAALTSSHNPNSEGTNDYFGKLASGKRRLHSSGETGGFVGPGMHYHRRAESAPEMEPFERSRFGFPRLGSNPNMEDAIVEEDEDPHSDTKQEENQSLGLGVNVIEAEAISTEPIRRPSGRSTRTDGRRVLRRVATPPNPFPLLDPVEIADAEEEPRFSMITKSSDESSITPTVSPDCLSLRPASAPLDSALQTPSLTYGTTPETPSAVSSADYRKTSFDIREHRIHTARSSMTDRMTLNSSKAGDFSASSVDDVPSLTSSSSTMMSSLPNRFSGLDQPPGPTERSASLSAAVPYRSRPASSSKRASLASLSKLMGGPYNRSRLNIEETVPPDCPEKFEKKRHRISRMMRFWKSKEKMSTG